MKDVSLDLRLMFGVVASAFLASLSMMCGCRLTCIPLVIGFAVAAVFGNSLRRSFYMLVLLSAITLVAVALPTYGGADAIICYAPLQRLLVNGWNPVWQHDSASIDALTGSLGLAVDHLLALPRLNAIMGAMVSLLTGSFTGDAFLALVLFISLAICAYRFGCHCFGSQASAVAIAAVSACSTKLSSFLIGQVDYSAYATSLMAGYAAVLWLSKRRFADLLLVWLSLSACVASKATGISVAGSLLLVLLLVDWRMARYLALGLLVSLLVLCWSPYFVNWFANGSPFPANDLTADFSGNADALQMGCFSRVVYAWLSTRLAILGCSWWYDNPNFNPVFTVFGGVEGLGMYFRLALFASLVLFALSRRTAVTWLCLWLFVSANLLPVRYIGYSRYQYQLWVIPFLALLNFLHHPAYLFRQLNETWTLRTLVPLGMLMLAIALLLRTANLGVRQWQLERRRQAIIRQLRQIRPECGWSIPCRPCAYLLSERLRYGGVNVNPSAPPIACDSVDFLPIIPKP